MKWLGMGKPRKVIKNIYLMSLGDIPPAFILRPKVIAAIRREIVGDIKKGLKRVPSGVQVEWKNQSLAAQLLDKLGGRK